MLKSILKWNSTKNNEINKQQKSYLYVFLLAIFQDAVFWKKWWFSLFFFICFNLIFSLCVYRQINLFEFTITCSIVVLIIDGFEVWLKYKHRTSCLKRLGNQDISEITTICKLTYNWSERILNDYIYLRNINHTKAFLLLEITFTITFFIGKYFNGYMLTYGVCTLLLFLQKLLPHAMKIVKRIQQNAESDLELEGLLPEASDENLDLLAFESEIKVPDDRQSLDLWKPEDLPLAEISDDSSDNSSSLATNLSMEKMHTLTKDVEETDSSEDEYIPHQEQPPEHAQTSMEVYPTGTWSNAAYNMFTNIGGAVANIVYNPVKDKKRKKRVSSADSSDGFEIIDKNDVIQ